MLVVNRPKGVTKHFWQKPPKKMISQNSNVPRFSDPGKRRKIDEGFEQKPLDDIRKKKCFKRSLLLES